VSLHRAQTRVLKTLIVKKDGSVDLMDAQLKQANVKLHLKNVLLWNYMLLSVDATEILIVGTVRED